MVERNLVLVASQSPSENTAQTLDVAQPAEDKFTFFKFPFGVMRRLMLANSKLALCYKPVKDKDGNPVINEDGQPQQTIPPENMEMFFDVMAEIQGVVAPMILHVPPQYIADDWLAASGSSADLTPGRITASMLEQYITFEGIQALLMAAGEQVGSTSKAIEKKGN